jgi:putative nucleotidyltransferase with HDIG domain
VEVRHRTLLAAHLTVLAAALGGAAVSSAAGDWTPAGVFVALLVLAVGSDLLALQVRGLELSGSFAAIILAAVVLGPAPAVMIGLAPIVVSAFRNPRPVAVLASNLATYATFPLLAGLAAGAVNLHWQDNVTLAGTTVFVFMAANLLNFVMIYAFWAAYQGWRWADGFRDMYLPVLPAQLGMAVVTTALIHVERVVGPEAIILFAPTILVFQWLLRTALAAYERGEQLVERNQQLAALQFGLISTTMKTLALRDRMTARHSAAVARYTREMAAELGLPPEEQEVLHTAGLFHDIGKFIFPDSILFAATGLSDEQYEIVRRHPEVGADLIAEIDGYGPVAKIVRHHHERIDGRGYPWGLSGDQIPLGSRIIAIADVYDVITARDTYRKPVSTSEAFAELRRSGGTQLDAELVEVFIDLVSRRGLMFSHSSPDDFEAELALERRVSDYAAPRAAVA